MSASSISPADDAFGQRGPRTVATGIVAFRPNPAILANLARTLLADGLRVAIFVNAEIDPTIVSELSAEGAAFIDCDFNVGVAEALNILILDAALRGFERIVLFDQDSSPPRGMVALLDDAMTRLASAGRRPAVIGPVIAAPPGREAHFRSPRIFVRPGQTAVPPLMPCEYLITSGSLVDVAAFRAIGSYRSDFFIDAVDTEWCFRAWSVGYSCWSHGDARMPHTIGGGVIRIPIIGKTYPDQRLFRHYAYFRNQMACLRMAHVPRMWKAKIAAHLALLSVAVVLHHPPYVKTLRFLASALRDGWRGRLGPPPGAARTRKSPLV